MPDLTEEPRPQPGAAPGPAVAARSLTVRAGDRLLLEQASAEFAPGQVALIVGCSGAGKSVLLRILAGLIGPAEPQIRVTGEVLVNGNRTLPWGHASEVGVVFQDGALFDELSPLENVRLARAHRSKVRGSGGDLDPEALLRELRVPRDVPTRALSGGQRQRLAIARVLALDPAVILYDEPTSGLDLATAAEVARLIQSTHLTHPKTSIIVTHDYQSLGPIADRIYVLDTRTRALRQVEPSAWPSLQQHLHPPLVEPTSAAAPAAGTARWFRQLARAMSGLLAGTSRAVEAVITAPLYLLPWWRSVRWGVRYLRHYLWLVTGPSAWLYIAIAGAIAGFVTTYFSFAYLPLAGVTEPLVLEDLLTAIGFSLYRVLVPVLATVLIAARSGAAVASDLGGKAYGQQIDALRTFGVRPKRYLLTGTLQAFLLGTPFLVLLAFLAARLTSLVVFTALYPERGPLFWELHFHRELTRADAILYQGTSWLLSKTLLCGAGIGLIAYYRGVERKASGSEVSRGITSTILWATLYVLVIHFIFAFYEFTDFR